MADKEFVYVKESEPVVLGDATKRHYEIEKGHYNVNGKPGKTKYYVFDVSFDREGNLTRSSKAWESIAVDIYEMMKGAGI